MWLFTRFFILSVQRIEKDRAYRERQIMVEIEEKDRIVALYKISSPLGCIASSDKSYEHGKWILSPIVQ